MYRMHKNSEYVRNTFIKPFKNHNLCSTCCLWTYMNTFRRRIIAFLLEWIEICNWAIFRSAKIGGKTGIGGGSDAEFKMTGIYFSISPFLQPQKESVYLKSRARYIIKRGSYFKSVISMHIDQLLCNCVSIKNVSEIRSVSTSPIFGLKTRHLMSLERYHWFQFLAYEVILICITLHLIPVPSIWGPENAHELHTTEVPWTLPSVPAPDIWALKNAHEPFTNYRLMSSERYPQFQFQVSEVLRTLPSIPVPCIWGP